MRKQLPTRTPRTLYASAKLREIQRDTRCAIREYERALTRVELAAERRRGTTQE